MKTLASFHTSPSPGQAPKQEHGNLSLAAGDKMFDLNCFTYQMFRWTYGDSLQLELIVEGFEGRDVLVEWREVSGENTLETGGQVILPPHLPQAEHTVLTAQELHTHTQTADINMD